MKPAADPDFLWRAFAREARDEAGRLQIPTERAPERAALALVASADGASDAATHGALSALLLGRDRERLVAFWLATGGPGFAIACATHERRWLAVHPPARSGRGLDLGTRWLEPRSEDKVSVALDAATWETLEAAFRKLTKGQRLAAQEEVRAARAGAPAALALWASSAALLAEEAAIDVRALPPPVPPEIEAWVTAALFALAAEPSDLGRELAAEILERATVAALPRIAKHPKEIVRLLGDDALGPLVTLLVTAHRTPWADATAVKRVAEALATSEAPVVGAFFRKHVDSQLIGKIAAAWVAEREANPRAAEVHAQAEAERKVRSKRAKKVAKVVTARKKIEQIVTTAREASEEEIPWVLRHPPWTRAGAPPLPEATLPDDFEAVLHVSESDREGIDETTEVDDDDPVGLLAQQGLAVLPKLLAQPIVVSIAGLRRVESPEVAIRMLDAMSTPRAAIAGAYFRAYPYASAIGLARAALDPSFRRRTEALEALGGLLAEHEPKVREAVDRYGEATAKALVTAARALSERVDSPDVPAWAKAATFPSVLLPNGLRLPESAARNLLALCTFGAHPALRTLDLDRSSTDRFLVALLEMGSRRGSLEGDAWVLFATAVLGGPDAARVVSQRAKEWNRERSTRELAATAVLALGQGGTGAALALSDLARKGGALGERATEVLSEVARREKLSPEELADFTVPTLDLDERGRAELDFGPRRFEVVLGDELVPVIVDEAGRPVKTVRMSKSDDVAKAQASLDRLKTIKKTMGEVARTVASRLELGMVLGRTWKGSMFRQNLVDHPIVGRIARRLLWSLVGGSLFRVAEDGTAADAEDALVALADDARVRLPHAMTLSEHDQRAWGELFGDYEIIEPFPQLARPTFTPTEDEKREAALARFRGMPAKQMAIQGRLLSRGWERIADFGVTTAYVRRFKSITAQYTLAEPFGFGEEASNETTLGAITFGVSLDRVPPLVFSEVAYDVHVLPDVTRGGAV